MAIIIRGDYAQLPTYRMTVDQPGKRWKITHNTPDDTKVTQRIYFVSLNMGRHKLDCSCPAARYTPKKPCKHVRNVATIIGRPELAWFGEDMVPF